MPQGLNAAQPGFKPDRRRNFRSKVFAVNEGKARWLKQKS
jgi:hypothetical protein